MEYYAFVKATLQQTVLVFAVFSSWTFCRTESSERDSRLRLDKPFSNNTVILDSTVQCHQDAAIYYPYDSWSCHDMTIRGKRLRYWYADKMGAKCGDNDHGSKFKGENDVAAVCRELLRVHGIVRNLWAAVVNNASCAHSRDRRVILKQGENGKFEWHEVDGGTGFVISLQCVVMPAK